MNLNLLLKDKRIFIIEDNVNNMVMSKTLLEREGATIWFDRYGDNTFERLKEFMPVDLILLDLMFPNKVTGYDLFERIRQMPEFGSVPIVALSASDPSSAIPKTRAMGFAGFIAKPISYELFAKQIAQVIFDKEEVWINANG